MVELLVRVEGRWKVVVQVAELVEMVEQVEQVQVRAQLLYSMSMKVCHL